MEITKLLFIFVTLTLSVQVLHAEDNNAGKPTKPPFNPLEDLILNQNQNVVKDEPLSRVKRQYGYYPGYYPVPIIVGGFGGYGGFGGFGGRRFGGRGFGGGGFGGRGFGGRGGGFGGGRGGGFGGGRGGRG